MQDSDRHVIGVVGAGVMGSDVAHCAARAGHQVILIDIADDLLVRARSSIIDLARLHRLIAGGQGAAPSKEILERITFSTDIVCLSESTFVIENATESIEVKEAIFRRLDAICASQVIFASGTSAIPITRLASVTDRAPRVLGIHFMNPVSLKPMVELITGFHTSDETIAAARELLSTMGKTAVLVQDAPGFVINRVLMLTLNEAIFLVHERVATAEDIDRIFKGCLGHKMGPLETADMIGLDTILQSIEVLYDSFSDSKYRPCPLLRQMVDAGLLGRKSGKGFFAYDIA